MLLLMMMMMMMMVRRGDLDLNHAAMPGCSDSVKEAMKKAMLQHEILFKTQVRELHRLYWTQKNLMKELCSKGAAEERAGMGGANGNRLKAFDLKLPADLYIKDAGGDQVHGHQPEAARRFPLYDRSALNAREVIDLEQSVDLQCHKEMDGISLPGFKQRSPHFCAGLMEHGGIPYVDQSNPKQQSTSCKQLHIDLNASLDEGSSYALHEPAPIVSSPSTSSSIVHHGGSDQSHTGTSHPNAVIWRESNNSSKETSFDSGLKCSRERYADGLIFSAQRMKVTENSWTHDQHKAESIACGSEFGGSAELYTNSAGRFISGLNIEAPNKVNGELPSPTCFYKSGDKVKDISLDQDLCHVDCESSRQASIATSNSNNIEEDATHASILSTTLQTPTTLLEGKQANFEGSEADTLSSHPAARDEQQKNELLEECPYEEQSNHVNKNNECSSQGDSVKRHTTWPSAEDCGTMLIDSVITENSPIKETGEIENHDRSSLTEKACGNGRMNHQDYIKKQSSQGGDLDFMVKKAAETLLCLSSENLACTSDQIGSSGSIGLDAEEGSKEPQYSSDSFESITLMLSESRNEECWTCSGPTLKDTGKEACGIRLRRGRRLRDFRKEILPGLVSLSRHEIYEDLHSIGYELRKNRFRNRANWLSPVRCRQSKRRSTRRRG